MKEELPSHIHHIHGSVALLAMRIFGVLLIVNTIYAVTLLFGGLGTDYHQAVFWLMWVVHFAVFIFETYLILLVVIPWTTTIYYLSDQKLVKHSGILRLEENIYTLDAVRSIDLKQSWIGRLFNYGDLIIEATDFGGYRHLIRLPGISDPRKYEQILEQFIQPLDT